MDTSVIVPAHNAASTIGACLEGLLRQTVPQSSYEVIVVDDGSSDGTRDTVASYDVRLVVQPHLGPAAARNRGVAEAKGRLVLFTDADCVPTESWIAEMVAPFSEAEVVGVKGAYGTRQVGIVPRFVQREYEARYGRMAKESRIDFIDTYSAGYRRTVFLQEGGFDVRYPSASVEDQEFSFRLAEQGYRLVFNRYAVVYHQHPETLAAYVKRKFNIGYWKVSVVQRHPRKALRDSHTPESLKAQMGLVLLLLALLLLSFVGGAFTCPFLLALAMFLGSVAPFTIEALCDEPRVGVVAPFLLFLRAVALASGMAKGVVDFGLLRSFKNS
jgi:glycosyltransferase involved in cell wall biosynthesis